jgi:hypothetical protein
MCRGTFKRVNMGSDRHLILQSPTEPNAYLNIDQETLFAILMATASVHQKAMMAVEPLSLTRVKGLLDSIDQTRPPKSFQDAIMTQREDAQEWRLSARNIWPSTTQRIQACPASEGDEAYGHDNPVGVQNHKRHVR